MIPVAFDYQAPKTIDDAVALLAANPDEAKILAGGHSLIPAMKLRLAQPRLLIDIGRIEGLSYIREQGDHLAIGAMTTHYELESSELLQRVCPLLPACASHIGDVQVRNKGTIGGSLVHSDPAGDWPAAILALEGKLLTVGPKGEREIIADNFFVDLLTTSLAPDEILREIRVPKPTNKFGQAYEKLHHPASGFAVVGVAVALGFAQDGACASAGVGITGVGAKAYRASAVESALVGRTLNEQTVSAASTQACDGVDVNADLFASAEYRSHLATVYTRRAISAALKAS